MIGLNSVVEKFNQLDTQAVFSQFKSTAAEIEIFFKGKDMELIMANVKALTGNMKKSTDRVDKMLAAGRLDNVMLEARNTLKETKTLMITLQEEVRALKPPGGPGQDPGHRQRGQGHQRKPAADFRNPGVLRGPDQ